MLDTQDSPFHIKYIKTIKSHNSSQNSRSHNSRPGAHIHIMIDHLWTFEAILSNTVREVGHTIISPFYILYKETKQSPVTRVKMVAA